MRHGTGVLAVPQPTSCRRRHCEELLYLDIIWFHNTIFIFNACFDRGPLFPFFLLLLIKELCPSAVNRLLTKNAPLPEMVDMADFLS